MDQQETSFIIYEGVVVPESVLFKRERSNRYGSVEGLPDEELVGPEELERCILRNEWGSVLFLPKSKSKGFNPAWNWSVDVDFNAFASVDFERTQPKFDKARYKADKLKEQLKDLLILRAIVSDRIPDEVKGKLLQYVKSGIIEVDDIRDWDMWQLAKLYKRALGLARQIIEIREVSKRRR
jgi:hypothetical protein